MWCELNKNDKKQIDAELHKKKQKKTMMWKSNKNQIKYKSSAHELHKNYVKTKTRKTWFLFLL